MIPPRGGNGPPLSGGAVGAASVWVNRWLLLTDAEHLTANRLVDLEIRLHDRIEFRFHDLRHTGNTLAASSGASTRELMHRMGTRFYALH